MVLTMMSMSLAQSSLSSLSVSPMLFSSKTLPRPTHAVFLSRHSKFSLSQSNRYLRLHTSPSSSRGRHSICFYNRDEDKFQHKESELAWPILKRWDVPWKWQTVSLTSLACGISFVLTGLIEAAAIPYLGLQIGELSLDEKAEILFLDQGITTAVVLVVLYSLTNTFQPRPDDLFRYDLREPFDLQKGWLSWAAIGLVGALIAIALTGAALSLFGGEDPQRETDALVRLLPLIGSSSISTVCLLGITGVLAPLLEETLFRGFLMVSLTKWLPTPVSVLISAAVFAVAHLTPGQFPQLFVLGIALGFSYAQTRNLLAPITIHALWNSGVILLLTFLQVQGYDIRELLQASS
ncbi:hypothetical protein CsSME_00021999 [Camellia sinensis var. sinensis]|uniref:CAAX prenyl protease 2/Lysostaphin resistance protein A-like domain-containing protein n=1 Tax=Camellia sinensis var. sinensis TaxID=542762 RepID=A0A4V6RYN6_CAMSN|nr:uncharacterized protein LOC114264485 [Camellia sinensis]THG18247.1 hypothetical protein TEA_017191 [Camellia sinensis var. sinensis]